MTTRTRSVSRTRQDRVPLDAYATPLELAVKLCEWLKGKGINPARILEPSAGHGDFVTAARVTWPQAFIVANEIQPMLVTKQAMREYLLAAAQAKKAKQPAPPEPTPTLDTREVLMTAGANHATTMDFLTYKYDPQEPERTTFGPEPFNLIVGNPPYSQGGGAEAHVRKALEIWLLAPGGVLGQVLKMHFRGTDKRIDFWNEHPFACDPPIVPRPDFTGDGRDTVEYTFYCWHRPTFSSIPQAWREHCAPAIVWKESRNG